MHLVNKQLHNEFHKFSYELLDQIFHEICMKHIVLWQFFHNFETKTYKIIYCHYHRSLKQKIWNKSVLKKFPLPQLRKEKKHFKCNYEFLLKIMVPFFTFIIKQLWQKKSGKFTIDVHIKHSEYELGFKSDLYIFLSYVLNSLKFCYENF